MPRVRTIQTLACGLLAAATCSANAGLIYSNIIPSLGGPDSTTVTAMISDAEGNVYLAGSTSNAAFPTTAGVVQTALKAGGCTYQSGTPFNPPPVLPCPDAFVVKLDAHGAIAFATLLGGTYYDQASSIAVDAAGNVYVAGTTTSGDFPVPSGQPSPSLAPTFMAKLNPTGTALLYSALISGTGEFPFMAPFQANVPLPETTISIAVDSAGELYFAAGASSVFHQTAGALQQTGPMAFGKLDANGSLVSGTYFGGSGMERPTGITLDASGDAYITGWTTSPDFPVTPGALQTKLPTGVTNSFVLKLSAGLDKIVYSTYLGGSSFAKASGIRVDRAGNAYVLGSLGSSGFPVTAGAFDTTFRPGFSSFLAKLNPDATALVYATFVSTNGLPPTLFDVDVAGDAVVSGQTGVGFPVSSDAFQPCVGGGGDDAFVAELTPTGTLAAATYLGGSKLENAFGVTFSPDGAVVLAGTTASADFPVTASSPLKPPGFFVTKFHISDPSNAGLPCLTLALENAASFETGSIAPGELVTLWGQNFGPAIGASMQIDSSGLIATNLSGAQVLFNGVAAPLLYAQAQQINAQVPWEIAGKENVEVHVEFNGASTQSAVADVAPSAPGFFHLTPGSAQGAIVNADGTLNSPANPAQAGTTVSVYGTGGGVTSPASITGGIAPITPLSNLTLPVSIEIDGSVDADVSYSGAAPTVISGVVQINFKIPPNTPASSSHMLTIKIGTSTAATVTIATN